MKYRITPIVYFILLFLAFICAYFFKFTLPIPIISFILIIIFLSYQSGKEIILRTKEKNWQRDKIFIEAQQIEELTKSESIELFPDIQLELINLAIEKYKSIEEDGYASDLQIKSQAALSIR